MSHAYCSDLPAGHQQLLLVAWQDCHPAVGLNLRQILLIEPRQQVPIWWARGLGLNQGVGLGFRVRVCRVWNQSQGIFQRCPPHSGLVRFSESVSWSLVYVASWRPLISCYDRG